MGYGQQHALVSMTNKDVYYVTQQTAKELMTLMATPDKHPASFETIDSKSNSEIAITIVNVSSVVIPDKSRMTGGYNA